MLIRDVNNKIENIDNQIEYWLSIKELEELRYENGKMMTKKEFNERCTSINSEIDNLYTEKNKLNLYIDNYLKETNQYDEVLKEIIYCKEESLDEYTWDEIADRVHYSPQHCKRIYSRYKKQRYVD